MNLFRAARRPFAATLVAATLAAAQPAFSQDIAESHVRAARAAIDSLNATEEFDLILPAAAQALKAELIQKDPHLQQLIISIVDEKTLALVGRRADLEREAALAYARSFSEDDLKAIAQFYTSPAGRSLIEKGPLVTRELLQAAEIWQRGVARDLAVSVGEEIAKRAGSGQTAPAQ